MTPLPVLPSLLLLTLLAPLLTRSPLAVAVAVASAKVALPKSLLLHKPNSFDKPTDTENHSPAWHFMLCGACRAIIAVAVIRHHHGPGGRGSSSESNTIVRKAVSVGATWSGRRASGASNTASVVSHGTLEGQPFAVTNSADRGRSNHFRKERSDRETRGRRNLDHTEARAEPCHCIIYFLRYPGSSPWRCILGR